LRCSVNVPARERDEPFEPTRVASHASEPPVERTAAEEVAELAFDEAGDGRGGGVGEEAIEVRAHDWWSTVSAGVRGSWTPGSTRVRSQRRAATRAPTRIGRVHRSGADAAGACDNPSNRSLRHLLEDVRDTGVRRSPRPRRDGRSDDVAAPVDYDCRTCGACCANPDENRAQGVVDWVEVGDAGPLLDDARLTSRLVAMNPAGERHLRLDAGGRCLALRGRIGGRVSCTIYALRPAGCWRVEPGDTRCLQYRPERGVDR